MASTIRDVARLAQVSVSTVSRVLNDEGNVKKETVVRVKSAIDECHYVPNTFARNLKSNSSKTVGLLISDISNSHFTSMAKVIETILRENGFNMIICSTDENKEQELNYLNHMLSSRVDGLILNTTNLNNASIVEFSARLPVVLIERSIDSTAFRGDYIGSNNREGIRMLTQSLIDQGHRKIGIINCESHVSTGRERLAGFVDAMRTIGITVNKQYPYLYDCTTFNIDNGFLGCRYFMQLPQPPTALVVTNNTLALGALKYLRINNFRIPEDISILTYGNIENSDLFFVDLGHATLNPYLIGEKAAKCILSRIAQPSLGNREVIFEPTFLANHSVMTL